MRLKIALATVAVAVAGPALAEPAQFIATIKEIRTGWNADQFAIVTNETPVHNPANCPSPDGYVATSDQPGYNTYYAASLVAFVERANVVLIVAEQGCPVGRPKLIGINIRR